MKKKELTDFRKKSIKQLEELIAKTRKELEDTNLDMSLGKESNLKKAANLRKDIAQLLTIIKEKEIIGEKKDDTDKKEEKK